MLKHSAAILLFICISVLVGCSPSEPRTVMVKDLYSIDIDGLLSPTTELHEDASLQYQNIFSQLFIIVLDEHTGEFERALTENELEAFYPNNLEGYAQLISASVAADVDIYEDGDLELFEINGLEAIKYQFKARSEDLDVFYYFVFVKGKEHYYQIFTWSTVEKMDSYLPKMDYMVSTFREL